MPTTITKTIGSGRDYASISAWFAGAVTDYPSGLVANDVIWKGELYDEGGGTNGEWTVSSTPTAASLTCDATRYYLLEAAPGRSFYDDADKLTNALRYNNANGVAVSVTGNYTHLIDASVAAAVVVVRGLQIKAQGGYITSGSNLASVVLDRCIVQGGRTAGIFEQNTSGVNCVIIPTDALGCVQGSNTGNRYWRNCTIWGAGAANAFAYGNYASGNIIANCAIFGFSGIVSNTARITTSASVNIATDLSSVGWTAGSGAHVTSLTASAQFVSVTGGSEDFRLKAGNSIATSGARDQTNTGDIDVIGSSRSTSTPSIGAWEYLAPAPNAPTGVTVGSITATSASVSWTDASSDETGFKVRYAPSPYSSWTTATGSVAASPYTVTGLSDGTSYKAGVAAFNGNGDSTWAESGVFTTTALTRLRPSADTSKGSWSASSGSVLYSMIDEANADDSDYITAATNTTCKIKLENGTDPVSGANHLLRVRARGTGGTLRAELVQSATPETTIASWSITYTASFTDFDLSLTSAQADAITDYSALYVKLISS